MAHAGRGSHNIFGNIRSQRKAFRGKKYRRYTSWNW